MKKYLPYLILLFLLGMGSHSLDYREEPIQVRFYNDESKLIPYLRLEVNNSIGSSVYNPTEADTILSTDSNGELFLNEGMNIGYTRYAGCNPRFEMADAHGFRIKVTRWKGYTITFLYGQDLKSGYVTQNDTIIVWPGEHTYYYRQKNTSPNKLRILPHIKLMESYYFR